MATKAKDPKTVTLTPELLKRYRDFVYEHAYKRKLAQGERFNAVDFAVGAMCIYFFFEIQDQIPAPWLFNPLSGKDPFEERKT